MHGNDYELNTKLSYSIITCALSFERMVPLLALMGMLPLSTTPHYKTKALTEPVLADMAEVRSGSLSHSLSHSQDARLRRLLRSLLRLTAPLHRRRRQRLPRLPSLLHARARTRYARGRGP